MWPIIFIILAVLYLLNPYDILPDFFLGAGWLDDLVIFGFLARYLYKLKKKQEASRQYHKNSRNSGQGGRQTAGDHQSGGHNHSKDSSTGPWDPYQILEIDRSASQEEIKQAFRQLAGKYHPDKVEHLGAEFKTLAEERFKEIQRAYEQLRRE